MQGKFPLCLPKNSQSEAGEIMAEGFFRSKKGFTVVQNEITKDNTISLKAKGLYLVIQAHITMPDRKWTKDDFMRLTREGRKAFDSAWQELKDTGYLKVHIMADGGRWHTEYELLDEPESGPHTLYHNKDGEITSDNIKRAAKKKEKADQAKDDHYPQNGSNGNGSNGNGSNDFGSNANGGNNNKTLQINTEDNSYHSTSNQNPYQQKVMEQYPMGYLKELYKANDLILMGVSDADVEMVKDILYDAVNTTEKTIYQWDRMLPMGKEKALELYQKGYMIQKLYQDDTETYVQNMDDLQGHDGMFGIEKEDWERCRDKEMHEREEKRREHRIIH